MPPLALSLKPATPFGTYPPTLPYAGFPPLGEIVNRARHLLFNENISNSRKGIMEFENKVLSKELLALLYESDRTVGTAESCTSGMIATCITSVPGASDYFKGGIVCYTDEVKTSLLNVDADIIAEKTAVCEDVAIQMVTGAIDTLNVHYAVSATGFAGPGSADGIPVGTIWLACGNKDEQVTMKLSVDEGREKNINNAVKEAMTMLINFIKDHEPPRVGDEVVELTAE